MNIISISEYDSRYIPYFVQVEQISREYLPDNPLTTEEGGVVEEPFTEALLRDLLSHKGGYLVLAVDEGQGKVLGFSEFHTCDRDFPRQTEDLASVMADFSPFAWWFYVVKPRRLASTRGITTALCQATFDTMLADGCRYAVADYMLTPEFCNAGRRLLTGLGFKYAYRHYGLGLVPPEEREPDDRDRVDTYEIMIKDLYEYAANKTLWSTVQKRNPC